MGNREEGQERSRREGETKSLPQGVLKGGTESKYGAAKAPMVGLSLHAKRRRGKGALQKGWQSGSTSPLVAEASGQKKKVNQIEAGENRNASECTGRI